MKNTVHRYETREPGTLGRNVMALKVAGFLSTVFNPLYLAPFAVFAGALKVSKSVGWAFVWGGICVTLSTVLPLVDLLVRMKLGTVSDFHVSKKEERTAPMLFNIGYLTAGALLLSLLGAPKELIAFEVGALLIIVVALVVTFWWKISLHAIGLVEIYVMLMLIFYGWSFVFYNLYFLVLIIAVCWARIYLKKHTLGQVIAGSAAGAAIPVLVFWAFGLL